jgi:hypothetical protein
LAGARDGLGLVASVAGGFFAAGVDLRFEAVGDAFAGAGVALVDDGTGTFMPGIPGM